MKKIILSLIILLLTTNNCFSIVEEKRISLKDAIDLALETNPQVKMSKLDVERSKNDIKSANKLQNPSIHTFMNMGEASEGNPQQIGADYTIEILKRNKRKETAKSKSYEAIDNQKFQEYSLIYEVKKSYIDLLLKKTNLTIIEKQKELSKELLDNTIKDSNKGKIPKTDVLQAKIAYNRSIMYYNIAKSEVVSSQNRFNSVMNTKNVDYDTKENTLSDNYEDLMTINPKDENISFQKIKDYTLLNRYDLLSAKQEVTSAENNLKVVKSNLIPDIEFTGGYAYQTKGISDTGHFQNGAYAGARLVNLPLIYHYKPEIENAKLEIEKAKLKYEDVLIDVTRNITDAWEKYVISKDNLNFYNKELLSNSKELLDASIDGLAKKEIDITSFLVTKKLYLELILGYYNALAEYYISYAELLKEMNIEDLNDTEIKDAL